MIIKNMKVALNLVLLCLLASLPGVAMSAEPSSNDRMKSTFDTVDSILYGQKKTAPPAPPPSTYEPTQQALPSSSSQQALPAADTPVRPQNSTAEQNQKQLKSFAEVNEEFMDALTKRDLSAVSNLINMGADVNTKDDYGQTALMLASDALKIELVQELLAKKADVNAAQGNGKTALIRACDSESDQHQLVQKVVQALLDKGAKVNAKTDDSFTALHAAANRGHLEVIQILLAKGADVTVMDEQGTVLNAPSSQGHLEIVRALIAKGVDINAQAEGKFGRTALISASLFGKTEVVKLLLASGAKVNVKTDSGLTALMAASDDLHVDVVKLFLENGAEVNAKTNDGWTALRMASKWRGSTFQGEERKHEVVKLLIAYGAK